MKTILILLLPLLLFYPSLQAAPEKWETDYSRLLKTYATPQGVRYAKWKASSADLQALSGVTEAIAGAAPDKLSRDEQLAFYLNAYNAWTIKNVLDAYPIKSIEDVYPLFGFFTRKTIIVAGKKMSLNELEKGIIIARFKEPRIHTAINCASTSCPELISEVFTAAKLESQLTATFRKFVNENPLGVSLPADGKTVNISSIFKWFAADFKPAGGAVAYINQFRKTPIPASAKVKFQDYDWSLNEAK